MPMTGEEQVYSEPRMRIKVRCYSPKASWMFAWARCLGCEDVEDLFPTSRDLKSSQLQVFTDCWERGQKKTQRRKKEDMGTARYRDNIRMEDLEVREEKD